MDRVSIEGIFEAHGLTRLLKENNLLIRPSIRLYTYEPEQSNLTEGTSHLGGLPDLPLGTCWPRRKALPLSFIAQLRLAELHPYDQEGFLPEDGMLWFFYDALQQTLGESPADPDGWCVLFARGIPTRLQRTAAPEELPQESRFRPSPISYAHELTLPRQPELELPDLDWTPGERQRYEQLLSIFPTPADYTALHNRMFGYPEALPGTTRLQDWPMRQASESGDLRVTGLKQGTHDWLLLLQVDSDEHAGMRWANSGLLSYWITKADLHARQFDTTRLAL